MTALPTTPAPASAPRGRPRDPARGARILEAAVALIAELGYDRATVEAIAERAGVGKPTIYRRWSGKAEIVAAAIPARKGSATPAATGTPRGEPGPEGRAHARRHRHPARRSARPRRPPPRDAARRGRPARGRSDSPPA